MEFTKNIIKSILDNYNSLYSKISEIIDLYSSRDNCYYEIKEINYYEDCLSVNVEFYKWQDINFSIIYINLDILINEESFITFKREIEEKIEKDKLLKEEEKNKEKANKINEAKKLLKENGIINID